MANEELDRLRKKAQSEGEMLGEVTESALTLPDMLRESLTRKLSRDDPIIKQRESALSNFLSSADRARAEFSPQQQDVVLSPTQQRALVSSRRASALTPLASLNDIMAARGMGLENIIGSTGRAAQAEVQRQQLRSQAAQQAFSNLISQKQLQLQQAKAAAEKEDVEENVLSAVNQMRLLRNQGSPGLNLLEHITFGARRSLASQTLARAFEKGRLSDQDRLFYKKLMPTRFDPWYDQKLAAIEKSLRVNAGLESPENPRLQMPDGTVYEYDSISDPDYKQDVQEGGIPIE